ncbi:ATP-binding protein [Planktothrix paucivesiculata]|nr:hypothetical protein [Planktothrix paucivesiculata]
MKLSKTYHNTIKLFCKSSFDPREKLSLEEETLDLPLEERRIGGLGIYLTISGVDEFQYKRVGDRNLNIFIMYR